MDSYVTLKSSKVTEMARRTLETILESRAERLRSICEAYRQRSFNRFWWKLTRQAPPSDDDVVAHLKANASPFSAINYVDIMHGFQQDVAMRLLRASQNADEVNVSLTDLDQLVG